MGCILFLGLHFIGVETMKKILVLLGAMFVMFQQHAFAEKTHSYQIIVRKGSITVLNYPKKKATTNYTIKRAVQTWFMKEAYRQAEKIDPQKRYRNPQYWEVKATLIGYSSEDEFTPSYPENKREYLTKWRVLGTWMPLRPWFKRFASASQGSIKAVITGAHYKDKQIKRGFTIKVVFSLRTKCMPRATSRPKRRAADT